MKNIHTILHFASSLVIFMLVGLMFYRMNHDKTYVCITEQTIKGHPLTSHNRTTLLKTFYIKGEEKDRKEAESSFKIKGRYTEDIYIKTTCE